MPYNRLELIEACRLLLKAGEVLTSDGFRYDLVDVMRQALANYSNVLQQEFAMAYRDKNRELYDVKTREFLKLIDDIDRLLATRSDFLLGRWLNSARRLGNSSLRKIYMRKMPVI
ncbi:MAG: hypothetical protein EP145_05395 [Bacteroides uniformis]|nr:hypothetical protein [Bacteroides uniformis]